MYRYTDLTNNKTKQECIEIILELQKIISDGRWKHYTELDEILWALEGGDQCFPSNLRTRLVRQVQRILNKIREDNRGN